MFSHIDFRWLLKARLTTFKIKAVVFGAPSQHLMNQMYVWIDGCIDGCMDGWRWMDGLRIFISCPTQIKGQL